uniref:Uncharacterized protein n=1 Tax=Rhizophora mucronata TaxID=61149 RepID=A0A2P2QQS6_RHIMU
MGVKRTNMQVKFNFGWGPASIFGFLYL